MLSSTSTVSVLEKRNTPNAITNKQLTVATDDVLLLVQKLQSSLELEVIFTHLLDHIRSLVPGCRLLYSSPESNINLPIGGPVLKHQCFYQLKAEQEQLGEIRISNSSKLTDYELSMVELCLSHLLYPLRNALLYREAIRNARQDALTGVGNRFAFSRNFEREQRLAQRYHQDLSLLVIDIDYFKRINDKYGHLAGDEVLKSVAECLKSVMRQTDMIFRYGGEEFTAILTKTDREGALVIAERIRKEVEKLAVTISGDDIKATVSVGIGSLKEVKDSQALFNQADDNLYLAKRGGRNQVR